MYIMLKDNENTKKNIKAIQKIYGVENVEITNDLFVDAKETVGVIDYIGTYFKEGICIRVSRGNDELLIPLTDVSTVYEI